VAKGRKTGGRQKGARNVASAGIKTLLGEVLSDGELKSRWKNWLGHRDERIAFEAFKLALSYLDSRGFKQNFRNMARSPWAQFANHFRKAFPSTEGSLTTSHSF
jgi:hypothetical protein